LDSSCRDYDDVDNVCDGAGNLVTNSCTVFSNNASDTVINSYNCDASDTSCADFNDGLILVMVLVILTLLVLVLVIIFTLVMLETV